MRVKVWRLMIAVALIALGRSVGAAELAGVDLVVTDIVPSATEPPKVLVLVENRGTKPLNRSFEVELRLDGAVLDRQRITENLFPNRKPLYVVFYRPTNMPRGLHTFEALADPERQVKELNRDNNLATVTVWAKGGSQQPQR